VIIGIDSSPIALKQSAVRMITELRELRIIDAKINFKITSKIAFMLHMKRHEKN